MFKLNTKFDADSFCFSFSHFQCDGHTVHMLTQQCLPPPMTSTVKLSLITHTCSSPLSLAARLHQCHANHSCYLNNSWTFFGQTLYIHICTHTHTHTHLLEMCETFCGSKSQSYTEGYSTRHSLPLIPTTLSHFLILSNLFLLPLQRANLISL